MKPGSRVRVRRAIYSDFPAGETGEVLGEYPETHGEGQAALLKVRADRDQTVRPFRAAELEELEEGDRGA